MKILTGSCGATARSLIPNPTAGRSPAATGLCVIALFVAGCRTPREPIPTFDRATAAESLDRIAERGRSVEDVTGKGTLTLADGDGGSVRLDVVYVLSPPGRARVRAWKFTRAVFDLTLRDGEVWLYAPRAQGAEDGLARFGEAVAAWLALLGGDLRGPGTTAEVDGDRLIVRRPMPGGLTLRGAIDRDTLTPRRYEGVDEEGRVRFRLRLGGYRPLGETVWPEVIEASSGGGTVRVEARQLDADVAPPTAFDPPRRARRIPTAASSAR